jgi:hypothetical protein
MECENTQRAYAAAVTMLSRAVAEGTSDEYIALREMEQTARFNRDAATMSLMQHQDLHTLARRIGPQPERDDNNPLKLAICA